MKKSLAINLAVFVGMLLYCFLFWRERMGINVLIYSTLLQVCLLKMQPESARRREVLVTGVGTFLTAILVVLLNSTLVKIVHVLSLMTLVGFVQLAELRFIWYALLLYLRNVVFVPVTAFQQLKTQGDIGDGLRRFRYVVTLMVIPLLILLVFYSIYYVANPKFAEVADSFWQSVFQFFQWDISLDTIFYLIMGLFVTGGALWKTSGERFVKWQQRKVKTIERKRPERSKMLVNRGVIDLKKEYQSGLILVIALDLLLVVVNALDIRYVWFGEQPTNPLDWKVYVHEGTYLLIGAILLAMAILVVLFRKNINFLPKNEALKIAAYVWIIQNALLALSVGVRNWRYVEHCGLAYKRIGVFLFLLLVLFGLYTMFTKVKKRKSLYFLIYKNSWAVYGLLIVATLINWDVFITKYNLTHKTEAQLDIAFLMKDISDKNLSLLIDNQDLMTRTVVWNTKRIQDHIEVKKGKFRHKMKWGSWKSWNYQDWRIQQKIN
ncbi:MAG: DUF4173 domain-containing protein [Saprospiraceae bacterium]